MNANTYINNIDGTEIHSTAFILKTNIKNKNKKK